MTCNYEMWDGAYVLGSLSPAERREFEEHLDTCQECSRAVRDLAGLPGLLGRIGPEVIEAGPTEPVPETLRPRLFRAVRRQRARRTWLTAGVAAAAAAAITLGGAVALDRGQPSAPTSGDRSGAVSIAPARAMTAVSNTHNPMTAQVSVTPVAWGTRLDLTCTYPRAFGLYEGSGRYALVVHTLNGKTHQVATWRGLPGRAMSLTASTAAPTSTIRSVDITTSEGKPVLRLQL